MNRGRTILPRPFGKLLPGRASGDLVLVADEGKPSRARRHIASRVPLSKQVHYEANAQCTNCTRDADNGHPPVRQSCHIAKGGQDTSWANSTFLIPPVYRQLPFTAQPPLSRGGFVDEEASSDCNWWESDAERVTSRRPYA